MRNQNRSHRGSRGDEGHNVAGVGELRAVAERLLEMGQQYLEQGREWLHEATRKEQGARAGHNHAGHAAHEPGAYRAGGERAESGPGWSSPRGTGGYGAYAPDESTFSETDGDTGWRANTGYDYDDHRTREFDDRAEELARRRGRGGHRHHYHGRHERPGAGAFEDPFLPGSYGFGGEGRRQAGSEQGGARWEQAYRAQGQGSFRGRGPRGYARSDARILEDVNERLCDDPIVDATEIEVRCEQACIVLEGRVPTRWMKHRAEDIADAVAGVKDVDNRIRVAAEEPASMGDFDTHRGTRGEDAQTGNQGASGTSGYGGSGPQGGAGRPGSASGSGASASAGRSGGSGSAAFQAGASQSTSTQSAASGATGGHERSQSSSPGAAASTTGSASSSSPSSGSQGTQAGASASSPSQGGQSGDPSKTPQQSH